ncbi:nitroreductase/quinone reductase family protein [Micromonospora sp. LOL_024]|uniref:nitroreductase/quinone reductase family protein n=1 Tax=Micromonospora sp. LOL_024 TaxID=3345412 RepID=UPI003A83F27D
MRDSGQYDEGVTEPSRPAKKPWLPPRWFIRLFWSAHRGVFRRSGGRVGLSRPRGNRYGMLRLTTVGRRTGQQRSVILGYFEDDGNLVSLAMNGWGEPEPAWWLNLQAHPDATVDLVDGPRPVRGRAATGEERSRLWARWREIDKNLDGYAARRSSETAVVVLMPQPGPSERVVCDLLPALRLADLCGPVADVVASR